MKNVTEDKPEFLEDSESSPQLRDLLNATVEGLEDEKLPPEELYIWDNTEGSAWLRTPTRTIPSVKYIRADLVEQIKACKNKE